jgi:hypothetical protein
MTRSTLRPLLAAFAAALVAGCHSDSPSGPANSQQNTLDLTTILSQMSLGRVSSVPGASSVIAVPSIAGAPVIVPASCSYSAAVQGFTCPTVSSGGLTWDISYFLYDAAGHSQSQADAGTTAAVRTVVDTKGTTSPPPANGISATVVLSDHSDLTMSGLLTTTHKLNGNGTSHYDMTLSGAASLHAVIDMTTATNNVVLPVQSDATTPAWPSSGTITTDTKTVTTIGNVGAVTTTSHAVITFNGTNTATIVYTTSLSTTITTCKVDLTGKSPPVCS